MRRGVQCSRLALLLLRLWGMRMQRVHEHVSESDEYARLQRFREDVCDLVLRRNPLQMDEFSVHLLAHKVMPDVDVLRARVQRVRMSDRDGRFVVAEDERH